MKPDPLKSSRNAGQAAAASEAEEGHGNVLNVGLKGIKYEQTKVENPPIPVASLPLRHSPRPTTSPANLSTNSRPASQAAWRKPATLRKEKPGTSSSGSTTHSTSSSVPRITLNGDGPSVRPVRARWPFGERSEKAKSQTNLPLPALKVVLPPTPAPSGLFLPLTTDIPSGNLLGLESPDHLTFSKRGSILLGGQKARPATKEHGEAGRPTSSPSPHQSPPSNKNQSQTPSINGKALSADDESLSQKVRSMYEYGDESANWLEDRISVLAGGEIEEEAIADDEEHHHHPQLIVGRQRSIRSASANGYVSRHASTRKSVRRTSMILREEHEIAGGIEDWKDIQGADVDRYGFIVPRKPPTSPDPSSSRSSRTPEPPARPHRVSTALQLASETPRSKRSPGRAPSRSNRFNRTAQRKSSTRSLGPPGSLASQASSSLTAGQQLRYVVNRLPGNRDRRWVDEAGDMLTLPPGLADIAESEEGGRAAAEMKRREWERTEKWTRMARPVRGMESGMGWDFDTADPKLISRTWKGIPDRWRAPAWHAFLTASAKKTRGCATDAEIVDRFYELLEQSSADDMQIDIDVPRTINSHIMFRRRYRGGQRLLFRVLHSLSLYFPATGYVQGMASLAATLLCYYDEDNAFVMLVRLWELRGLQRLYAPGFGGLMDALAEFERDWLADGEVALKLKELGIEATAYGTRWYLTLFNYSIPFQAQLRVWDVFMLLGDADCKAFSPTKTSSSSSLPASPPGFVGFAGGLDILHATAAALIDGMREILLDADFEVAMKVLTSWVPVRDEELLMKVAKAEWKQKKRRAA
ncbi:MAG: hypothetical protein M1829_000101 [Trizodia sp. TS-e1964]|nr:MAG: hypothetical protein M1829_000101 [Trizodia sp. TS-e1964]